MGWLEYWPLPWPLLYGTLPLRVLVVLSLAPLLMLLRRLHGPGVNSATGSP